MIKPLNNNFYLNFLIELEILNQIIKELNMRTMHNILENIRILSKERGYFTFQIKTFIWETGNKINSQVMESISTLMERNIKASLAKDLNLEEEFIHIKVALFIKVNGSKIEKLVSEFSFTRINKNTKEIGLTEKNMEKELIIIKMEINILEIGLKIKKTEWVFYNMHQKLFTMVSGLMIKLVIKVK